MLKVRRCGAVHGDQMLLKRLVDIALSSVALVLLSVPMAVVAILVKATSRGPALYWSARVGKDNVLFSMPKFRTMRVDTPVVATHLLGDSGRYLTSIGALLRRSSLDELPQLLSIVRGDMSIVGPRPALFNQTDLIGLRTRAGIHRMRPGLTGWAQVNGRDEVSTESKVVLDEYYLRHRSFAFDFWVLLITVRKVFTGEGVSH